MGGWIICIINCRRQLDSEISKAEQAVRHVPYVRGILHDSYVGRPTYTYIYMFFEGRGSFVTEACTVWVTT